MRVHPGERELDRQHSRTRPRLEEDGPGARHPSSPREEPSESAEVEIREDDVEPANERRVRELFGACLLFDGLRDREVEPVEARDPVRGRKRRVDRPHPLDDVADASRVRRAEHLLKVHAPLP